MSVSKWDYIPEKCDGDYCPGDCDNCPKGNQDEDPEEDDGKSKKYETLQY